MDADIGCSMSLTSLPTNAWRSVSLASSKQLMSSTFCPTCGLHSQAHDQSRFRIDTLIEAYRDKSGRPRQRILANLYGEQDTLRALAKLTIKHDVLLAQGEEERAEPSKRGAGFVLVTEHRLDRAQSPHCTHRPPAGHHRTKYGSHQRALHRERQ
jgi:hypothetical protein